MDNQFVIFRLEEQDYAVDINCVNEITEMKEITKVPNGEEYLEGILNLRGNTIPVINLKRKLMIKAENAGNQILVIESDQISCGLIIDSAKDVKTFPKDYIESIENTNGLSDNSQIKRIINDKGSNIILVLDMETVMVN